MSRLEGKAITSDDLKVWLKRKIVELEEDLHYYKAMLSILEGSMPISPPMPGEKSEDLKVGKKRIAIIFRGDGYVRSSPSFKAFLTSDLREYVNSVVNEIKTMQGEESTITLEIRENPDGSLREIRVEGLQSTVEELRIIGAMKYVLQTLYQQYKASLKASQKGSA
ncbi:MAG: hypothetical protein GSR79_04460 [Desulfurococcales archaeon]|nr:hypothetical protein [Desulfurococcales archaeon]